MSSFIILHQFIYLWTPGLSDNYLKVGEREYKRREPIFSCYGCNDYPPDTATNISSLFSELGDDFDYMRLIRNSYLLDERKNLEDEEFGEGISTYLTLKEAKRLVELLGEVNIKETEVIYP